MKEISVYVIMHKIVNLEYLNLDKCYKRLWVGKKECEDKTIQLDSEGDNISEKNSNYCELTGLYWMWKNSKSDIIGLTHYRRFFSLKNDSKSILTENKIREILQNYDLILPKKWISTKSVYNIYKDRHTAEDLDECKNIIKEICPEYISSYEKIIDGHQMHAFNMFIGSKMLINEYCEWLFTIFDKLESKIDISNRDTYQKRIYGFLSERLFNVWIDYKKLKVYECFCLNTEEKKLTKIKRFIKKIGVKIYLKIKE